VKLRTTLTDFETLHVLVTRPGERRPPRSIRIDGQLLADFLSDHSAMFRRLSSLDQVLEPETAETL
jgi:hypothetical protein